MNYYSDLENMPGTFEELSMRKHLPRRQYTDKPMLKYGSSDTRPMHLLSQGDTLAHCDSNNQKVTSAKALSSSITHNPNTHIKGKVTKPTKIRHGNNGYNLISGISNPYSRPLSAQEVIKDVQQSQWHRRFQSQLTSIGSSSVSAIGMCHSSSPYKFAEVDSNTETAALQLNSFLQPQSGVGHEYNQSFVKLLPWKKNQATVSRFGDCPEVGLKRNDEKQPLLKEGLNHDGSVKCSLPSEQSTKTALASAIIANDLARNLSSYPQHRQDKESRTNGHTIAAVRNPNYSPNKPYAYYNSIGNLEDNSADDEHNSNWVGILKHDVINKHHLLDSKTISLDLKNSRPQSIKLLTTDQVQRSLVDLHSLAGVEESNLPIDDASCSSMHKLRMLRKMPVTQTLTGTLYYKKSFREAEKEVEQKHLAALEHRPRADGAPSKQSQVPGEVKMLSAYSDEADEDEDNSSTPSGERLPGDGEASAEDSDDADDGIDDLYNDCQEDVDDDSDDYTISSTMSHTSSTVRLYSAASRHSSIQDAHIRTAGAGEEHRRPLTTEGERVQPALRCSLFPAIPPTINFVCEGEKVEQLPWEMRKFLKWRMSPITPNIVKLVLIRCHFRTTKKSHDWLGCFGKHMKANAFRSLREYQKLNHFPGSFQLGRKDRLWRNLSKMQVSFGKREFGFFPQTYVLPQDLKQLKRTWEDGSSRQKWIIKPPASARGIGIKVIHRWNQIPRKRPVIVQKYIGKPFLINDSKFDMRIYVYVSSYDPLRAYVFEDGLARFASCKYSPSMKSLNNKFMHLTNYSINKCNAEYENNTDDSVCQGHKWSLKSLWSYLKKHGVNTQLVWDSIKDIVVKTLISAEGSINSMIKSNVRSRYIVHELFGFDILLDEQLRPWILEVNISPSLHSNSQLDINIKGQMICDMLNLAGFRLPDKNDVQHVARSSASFTDLSTHIPSTDYCMDKRLFTNQLAPDERAKHVYFCHRHQDEQILQSILDILTPDDIRILTESIDEDSRKGGFIRVFPTPTTKKYLHYFEQPRYYNLLLDQWITRYNHMEQRGITLLQNLCEEGVHLENPTENIKHQWFPPNCTPTVLVKDKVNTSPPKKDVLPGHNKLSPSVSRLPKVRGKMAVAGTQSLSSISQGAGSSSSFSSLNTSPSVPNIAQLVDPSS